jgi:ubiquitin carboxyl-terminal hydrolase L5
MASGSWCTVESDPGVFTEMLQKFGVRGVQCEELWSLDEASLASLQPILGLFFLFKWERSRAGAQRSADSGSGGGADRMPAADEAPVFFARQVISNACGTLALINVLLNKTEEVDVGGTLSGFKAFTQGMPPDLVGAALEAADDVRVTHNAFARPEPFISVERAARDDDEVYHFVAFTRVGLQVLELDGLREAPVVVGRLSDVGQDWVPLAAAEIQRRIAALVADRLEAIRQSSQPLLRRAALVHALLERAQATDGLQTPTQVAAAAGLIEEGDEGDEGGAGAAAATRQQLLRPSDADIAAAAASSSAGDDAALLRAEYEHELLPRLVEAGAALREEREKRARWHGENERRRHNFVPFIVAALRAAAAHGKLGGMLDTGKQRAAAQRERARAEQR